MGEAGVEKLKEMEGSSPGSLAILLRQYSGVECYQSGITYRELGRRVDSISSILHNINTKEENKIFLFYLPVSFLTIALLLSSTLNKIRYCLMFEGFSPSSLNDILC